MIPNRKIKYISVSFNYYGKINEVSHDIFAFIDGASASTYYSKSGGLVNRTQIYITVADAAIVNPKVSDRIEYVFYGEKQNYSVQKVVSHKKYVGLVV